MSAPRNYWKEWWEHTVRFEKQILDTYHETVANGNTQTLFEFLEDLRKDWFKEMKAT